MGNDVKEMIEARLPPPGRNPSRMGGRAGRESNEGLEQIMVT